MISQHLRIMSGIIRDFDDVGHHLTNEKQV